MKKTTLFLALSIVASIVTLMWLMIPEKIEKPNPRPPIHVQYILVEKENMLDSYSTTATVEPKEKITITNRVPRMVKKRLVESGTKIRKNTPILELTPDFTIKAPIDGVLVDWKVTEGDQLSIGNELIQIINQDSLRVEYYVPAKYSANLFLGETVKLKELGLRHRIKAKISYISPIIEAKNYSILVHADIEDDNDLKPGTFVEVSQIIKEKRNIIAIPESALIPTLSGYEVYEIISGKLAKSKVTIGARQNDKVEIVSGLKEGSKVVVIRAPGMFPGAKVVSHKVNMKS